MQRPPCTLRLCVALAIAAYAVSAVSVARAQTIVVGAEDDAAPWSYPDGTGYVNDVVAAAFKAVGWTVQQRVLPYARCKASATKGLVTACFLMGRTPELEAAFLFPKEPVVNAQNLLLARQDSPMQGCDPSQWGRMPSIGIVRGYEYVGAVDDLTRNTSLKIDVSNSERSNLRKLQAGHLQAAVLTIDDVKQLDYVAKMAGVEPNFKTVCDFGSLPSHVGFSRTAPGSEQALAAFNEGYDRLKRRGELGALQTSWRIRALDRITVVKR